MQGELLDGFALDGCPDFELWLLRERERWRRLAADAWSALIANHRFNGNYDAAVSHARRLLAYIPWQESAHRHLMLLLALSGPAQRGSGTVRDLPPPAGRGVGRRTV